MATSVSRHGITWFFDDDYEVGQYANGDYWVVGPVTIVNINPLSIVDEFSRTLNGSMINPINQKIQGYDSATYGPYGPAWDPDLNVGRPGGNTLSASNPLVVPVNSSLVSSGSHPTAGQRPQLVDLAILTVIATPPASGSFRPPPYGTNKTPLANVSQLDFSFLPQLDAVPATPNLTTVTGGFERFWNEQDTNWTGRYLHASNNQPDYGRDINVRVNEGTLSLCLNYSIEQKYTLLLRMTQIGLDIYGALIYNGAVWPENGAHNPGRKTMMLLAGRALNDSAILAQCDASNYFGFAEERQTWILTEADVGRAVAAPRETYLAEDVGLPEWGITHYSTPSRDDRRWNASYRDVNGGVFLGSALAIRLFGLRTTWNWPPFFQYTDRYWENVKNLPTGGGNSVRAFVHQMFAAYRALEGNLPPPSNQVTIPYFTPPDPVFLNQVQVSIATGTSGASIYYTTNGTDPTTSSTLYTGPFVLTATTTVKALGVKAGMDDSAISSWTYFANGFTNDDVWTNVFMDTWDAAVRVEWDATPEFSPIDSVFGCSRLAATSFQGLATIARFNINGFIDARNGGAYQAATVVPYVGGQTYHFRMDINIISGSYNLYVTPPADTEKSIALFYLFRTEQVNTPNVSYINALSNNGLTEIENITITQLGGISNFKERLRRGVISRRRL